MQQAESIDALAQIDCLLLAWLEYGKACLLLLIIGDDLFLVVLVAVLAPVQHTPEVPPFRKYRLEPLLPRQHPWYRM